MIGKQELERTIKQAVEGRERSDAGALEALGYSAEAVESVGYDFGYRVLRRGVPAKDAIAAAFAAGLEVGVLLERERRDS